MLRWSGVVGQGGTKEGHRKTREQGGIARRGKGKGGKESSQLLCNLLFLLYHSLFFLWLPFLLWLVRFKICKKKC
jgi:hypothetical protein